MKCILLVVVFATTIYSMEEQLTRGHRRTNSISSFTEFERAQLQQRAKQSQSTTKDQSLSLVDVYQKMQKEILPKIEELTQQNERQSQAIIQLKTDLQNLQIKISQPQPSIQQNSIGWKSLLSGGFLLSCAAIYYYKFYTH